MREDRILRHVRHADRTRWKWTVRGGELGSAPVDAARMGGWAVSRGPPSASSPRRPCPRRPANRRPSRPRRLPAEGAYLVRSRGRRAWAGRPGGPGPPGRAAPWLVQVWECRPPLLPLRVAVLRRPFFRPARAPARHRLPPPQCLSPNHALRVAVRPLPPSVLHAPPDASLHAVQLCPCAAHLP